MNISVNEINVNYIDEGVGDVVLMLHGWGSNAGLFKSQIDVLKKQYRVIALNLPGFGGSDEPKTPFNVDDYAHFVLDFLNKLEINDVSLIGHSVGGRIIIKLMSYDNKNINVNKIVLVDSAGVKPKTQSKKTAKTYIYKISKKIVGNPVSKKLFPNALDNLKSKHGSADYRSATPMMRDTLVKIVNEDLTELFPKNTADTLIVWGTNDFDTPIKDGYLMEKMMPNSALVAIEGAGHYSFLDNPYLFNSILASYFKIKEA